MYGGEASHRLNETNVYWCTVFNDGRHKALMDRSLVRLLFESKKCPMQLYVRIRIVIVNAQDRLEHRLSSSCIHAASLKFRYQK